MTDSLTGLYIRRYLLQTTARKIDPRRLEARLRVGKLRPARIDPAHWRQFEALVADVAASGRTLVLVDMPTVDIVNALQADEARVVRDRLAALADAHPGRMNGTGVRESPRAGLMWAAWSGPDAHTDTGGSGLVGSTKADGFSGG